MRHGGRGRRRRAGDRPARRHRTSDLARLADSDLVNVTSPTGSLRLVARVTEATRPGAASIPHGWADCNVSVLVSAHDVDPLTGMPRSSGTAVAVHAVVPAAR